MVLYVIFSLILLPFSAYGMEQNQSAHCMSLLNRLPVEMRVHIAEELEEDQKSIAAQVDVPFVATGLELSALYYEVSKIVKSEIDRPFYKESVSALKSGLVHIMKHSNGQKIIRTLSAHPGWGAIINDAHVWYDRRNPDQVTCELLNTRLCSITTLWDLSQLHAMQDWFYSGMLCDFGQQEEHDHEEPMAKKAKTAKKELRNFVREFQLVCELMRVKKIA